MRCTKIVCTIGPASSSDKVLEGLIRAGMNVARLNFSHGDYASHRRVIRKIRHFERKLDQPVAVLQDLPGPKIRIGAVAGDRVRLQNRRPFVLTTQKILGSELAVSVNFSGLTEAVNKGDPILLGDGEIELETVEVGDREVKCRIVVGGILGSHKGIHFPKSSLNIRALTRHDKQDMAFGIAQNVDMVALSFVRDAEDILYARRDLKKRGASIPLIAKIEKAEAIEHLDEIIAAADGIMVARGDLGVETSVELVPVYQKRIIDRSIDAGKMVITATQMLQSMVNNPRPTRAEASDVANAVWDGTDCVMLSNETAAGAYPLAAVTMMARIIESAESGREKPLTFAKLAGKQSGRVSRALCEAAAYAAEELGTSVTAVFTASGLMARRLSSLRPDQRIIALTHKPEVLSELSLIWAVEPLLTKESRTTEEMLKHGEETLLEAGSVRPGEIIVVMAGRLSGLGLSSSVTIFTVAGNLGPTR